MASNPALMPQPPRVNHLKFSDSTLIFSKSLEDQIKNMKTTLLSFETVLRLKVNFFKSGPIGLGVEDQHLPCLGNLMDRKSNRSPSSFLSWLAALLGHGFETALVSD